MTDFLAALGRVLLAAIFILAGIGKLDDPAGIATYIAAAGLPMSDILVWAVIALEIGGGILLVVGFQTRLIAFALAAFSVAAAILFHGNIEDSSQMTQFMKNLAMAGGLLQVVAFGAGRLSLDGRGRAAAF